MKQFWRRMISLTTAVVMCLCLVCSPVWAAGAEVDDEVSMNNEEVVETAEEGSAAEPETKEPDSEKNSQVETPNEAVQPDDMGTLEIYGAQNPMDYYTAVSELVKEQEELGISGVGEYESARLLIKGEGNLDFSRYEGVQKVVSDMEGHYTVQFSDSQWAEEAAAVLNAMDAVEYAEPDGKMSICGSESDTKETGREDLEDGMGAKRASEHKSWGIGRIGADEYAAYAGSVSSRTVKVAVIDTGVNASHTYLEGRVLGGRDFVDNDSNPDDGHYHGTHVAGTIVDGTMELTNIKIVPVRVLNSQGKGSSSNVANGIKYAADQGVDVINMSLGGGHSSAIDEAVRYASSKNALCVVAAGNDNIDTSYECPAHIEEAVTVAAIDSDERKAYFSNYGDEVDLCAPGVDIVSCVPGGNYRSLNGTSMATPHAAACAALLKLANASYTPAQLQDAMKDSCRDLGDSGWDRYYGNGIIDLRKSLSDGNPDRAPATVTPSEQDVVLNPGESRTITITAGGDLPERFYLNYAESGSGFTCSWKGGWYGNHQHDLEITATEAGRGTITVSLKDSYADTAAATAQINVRVGDTRYPAGGTVSDWRYLESAHNYTSGSDYTWIYTSPEASRGMALTFDNQTKVENGYDYIYVYSGSATDGDDILVGTYTGTELAGQTINVSGQTVKIRLTSDGSLNYYGFKVTNLEAAGVKYPEGCDLVEDWHDLESQHNYESNSDYTWVYTYPGNAESLDVTFSEETKAESPFDHIYVMDGSGGEVGDYTGTELAGQTVHVPGKTVKIRLTSDSTLNCYGFRVSDLKAAASGGDDGDTIVDDWNRLESQHPYDNNYDHTWVYTYPGNAESLDVTFSGDTKVESRYDHIYIYTGDGTQAGDYTGEELAGKTVNVSGSTVKIRLTSDSTLAYYGFKVSDLKAGKSGSGFPESDHDYENNLDKTWEWRGPEDALNLDVAFDEQTKVENRYDRIYIYDGKDVELGDYTGTELAGKTVRVPGNVVKIRLTSDSSLTYYGFKVTEITPLYSNTNVTVKAQDISAPSGALAEVPVKISGNPGIAGLSFDVGYDEGLMTLVSAEAGSVLRRGTLSVNRNIVNWYNNDNVKEDGTLLTLKFRINSNAEPGSTTVNVGLHGGKKNLRDKDSNYIEAVYQSGTVSITGGLLGDLTGDGDLTIGDVVCLSQALDELIELDERQQSLADVDGDGSVDIGDLVRLYRIVLGEISPSAVLKNADAQDETPERTVNITVRSGTVSKGGKISLPVEISNNYGIAGLAFSVSIPEGYTLDSISEGSLLKGVGTFKVSGDNVIWYGNDNVTDDGVLFCINLTAGEAAQPGVVSVSLKDGKINNLVNQNRNSIGADFTDGTVTPEKENEPEEPVHIRTTAIDKIPNQIYTGGALMPELTIRDGNKMLKEGVDYTVSYSNNVNPGTALVLIAGKGSYTGFYITSFTIEGDDRDNTAVEKGRTYLVGNLKYKVTNAKTNGSGTVTLTGVKTKSITSASIGTTVKINGITFKVTAIASQALKGCGKLKTVNISANITQIGKDAFRGDKKLQKVTISSTALKTIGNQAFYGCSKLSAITLKTSRLNSVGKNAVKGIGRKAVVRVPAKKVKAYKKLFSKKTGFQSPMKVKK